MTDPERLLTYDEWSAEAARTRAMQRCAAGSHSPSSIVIDGLGMPVGTVPCSCRTITWTPTLTEEPGQ